MYGSLALFASRSRERVHSSTRTHSLACSLHIFRSGRSIPICTTHLVCVCVYLFFCLFPIASVAIEDRFGPRLPTKRTRKAPLRGPFNSTSDGRTRPQTQQRVTQCVRVCVCAPCRWCRCWRVRACHVANKGCESSNSNNLIRTNPKQQQNKRPLALFPLWVCAHRDHVYLPLEMMCTN